MAERKVSRGKRAGKTDEGGKLPRGLAGEVEAGRKVVGRVLKEAKAGVEKTLRELAPEPGKRLRKATRRARRR